MAQYPIKMLKDENGTPFVPLVAPEAVKDTQGTNWQTLIDRKLEKTNIIAGDNITLSVSGNNITINSQAGGATTNVIDNLNQQTGGVGVLDAHQGYVLKGMIPGVQNSLTSTSTTDALSAYQGYLLSNRSVPSGGTTGQVLKKKSNTDNDLEWSSLPTLATVATSGSYNDLSNKPNIDQKILGSHPIGSIEINTTGTNPSTYLGGTWVCDRQTAGGELIAFGAINCSGAANTAMTDRAWYSFSDEVVSLYRVSTIKNYVNGILTYDSNTFKCQTKGIVGMVKSTMYISGLASSTNQGFWFGGNGNTLPTGVTFLPNNGNGPLVGGGAVSNGYGGQGVLNMILVDTTNDVSFYINPKFSPYEGGFTGCAGGVMSSLMVEVYAKAGYYVWRRTA